MGNTSVKDGVNDEENTIAISLADSASAGARQAVIDAFGKFQCGGEEDCEIELVDMLSQAAAAGAKHAIDERARDLNGSSCFQSALKVVKYTSGAGASEGLKAVGSRLRHVDIESNDIKTILELAATAAGSGAWIACLLSAQANLTPAPNQASKYTALLGPMLGASMPASAAIYNILSGSTDFVKLCTFGSITLGMFVVSSGLVAGLLGATPGSVRYTKIATMVALSMVLIFYSVVLCSMFHSLSYLASCGAACSLLITILLLACWYFSC